MNSLIRVDGHRPGYQGPKQNEKAEAGKFAFSLCLAKHILLPSDIMDTSGPQTFWVDLETIGSPHSLVSK